MTPTECFRGKTVLVTGAGGSIGSEICRTLVRFPVAELRMVGHSELALYEIERELRTEYNRLVEGEVTYAGKTKLVTILGSVTDEKLMSRVMPGVDIVIHAAAHKHVPLCEENPLEAIINNVGGTIVAAQAASVHGVKKFILISSDKAVKPASIMGMTKRACELFLRYMRSRSSTEFTAVRFGNVLNSSGSVLPLWRAQLKAGKPITLTDKRCTRYFMETEDAVWLTLCAATLPADTYVLDMGEPRSLYRMALEVAGLHWNDELGCPADLDPNDYIEITGLRPGEKLHEELTYYGRTPTRIPKIFAADEGDNYPSDWVFRDLLMAARVGNKEHAVTALKELCQ